MLEDSSGNACQEWEPTAKSALASGSPEANISNKRKAAQLLGQLPDPQPLRPPPFGTGLNPLECGGSLSRPTTVGIQWDKAFRFSAVVSALSAGTSNGVPPHISSQRTLHPCRSFDDKICRAGFMRASLKFASRIGSCSPPKHTGRADRKPVTNTGAAVCCGQRQSVRSRELRLKQDAACMVRAGGWTWYTGGQPQVWQVACNIQYQRPVLLAQLLSCNKLLQSCGFELEQHKPHI